MKLSVWVSCCKTNQNMNSKYSRSAQSLSGMTEGESTSQGTNLSQLTRYRAHNDLWEPVHWPLWGWFTLFTLSKTPAEVRGCVTRWGKLYFKSALDPCQESINLKSVIIQYIIRVLKGKQSSQASRIVFPTLGGTEELKTPCWE